MKLTVCGGYVRILLASDDGDTDREDVLMASDPAVWAADGLEDMAKFAVAYRGPLVTVREPSVAVECVVSRGKPLVRWLFGWRAKELYLTPPHAVSVARLTRLAARDATRKAKELELKEPALFLG